jgi:hypothetical protein
MDTNMGRLNRCPEARAVLPEYVEGELSPLESRRLEGHLSHCAGCRKEEGEYRAAIGALRAPRPLAAHGDLYSGFAAKLGPTGFGAPRRQQPLRWAAASCLVLAVAGASASYFRGAFTQSPAPVAPASMVVKNTSPAHPKSPDEKSVAKNTPEPKFDFKSEVGGADTKANSTAAIPDPFDTRRVVRNDTPRESVDIAIESDSRPSVRRHPRATVASGERQDFLSVKPVHGPSADQIIIQQRREVTVAQYGAPQPTDDTAHVSNDHTQPVRPFVVATDPESKGSNMPSSSSPVAMAPTDESEVMVNGKPTDVQTAVGYDRRGRPVLVKMNIGAKPERDKVRPDK